MDGIDLRRERDAMARTLVAWLDAYEEWTLGRTDDDRLVALRKLRRCAGPTRVLLSRTGLSEEEGAKLRRRRVMLDVPQPKVPQRWPLVLAAFFSLAGIAAVVVFGLFLCGVVALTDFSGAAKIVMVTGGFGALSMLLVPARVLRQVRW